MIERVQFGGVVGAHGVVQAIPQFRELAGAINHNAGAGVAGVGFAGAVAVNADIKQMGDVAGSALAVSHTGSSRAGRFGRNLCAAAAKCLLCFCAGRERLKARAGISDHRPLSGRPIRKHAGLPS
jgi:hypothetical protein